MKDHTAQVPINKKQTKPAHRWRKKESSMCDRLFSEGEFSIPDRNDYHSSTSKCLGTIASQII